MGPGGLSRERAGFEVRDAHATTAVFVRLKPQKVPTLVWCLTSQATHALTSMVLLETLKGKLTVTAKDAAAGHIARSD